MLDATLELISLAASNSHMVFCVCNLITAILLVGSSTSKPSFQFNGEKPKVGPTPTTLEDEILKKDDVSLVEAEEVFAQKDDVSLVEAEEVSSVSETMVETEDMTPDQEEEKDDDHDHDDDDLKRRVEEFIAKTNREWRAEKLKAYSLGK